MPHHDLEERLVAGLRLQAVPHLDRDGAAVGGDAGHLAQGRGPVGEEHQRGLAEHHVERTGVEGERGGVAPAPLDVGTQPPGNRQHALVEVEPDDAAPPAHAVGGLPGHHAGAAADVQHGLAGRHPGRLDQMRCPLPEDRRDEPRLVDLRRRQRELERLRRAGHQGPPGVDRVACRQ